MSDMLDNKAPNKTPNKASNKTTTKAMMRNGKYLVEVDPETVDDLIVFNLRTSLDILKNDMKRRKNGDGLGFWSSDPKEDVKQYKRMIKAFEKVLWYYSGEETDDYPKKT